MCRLAIPILPSTTLTRVLVNLGEQAIEPEDKQPKLFIRHTLFEVADHALLGLKLVQLNNQHPQAMILVQKHLCTFLVVVLELPKHVELNLGDPVARQLRQHKLDLVVLSDHFVFIIPNRMFVTMPIDSRVHASTIFFTIYILTFSISISNTINTIIIDHISNATTITCTRITHNLNTTTTLISLTTAAVVLSNQFFHEANRQLSVDQGQVIDCLMDVICSDDPDIGCSCLYQNLLQLLFLLSRTLKMMAMVYVNFPLVLVTPNLSDNTAVSKLRKLGLLYSSSDVRNILVSSIKHHNLINDHILLFFLSLVLRLDGSVSPEHIDVCRQLGDLVGNRVPFQQLQEAVWL